MVLQKPSRVNNRAIELLRIKPVMAIFFVWLGAFGLLALWSFVAWALHGLTAWALAHAGGLTGVPAVVEALNLPQWLALWLPPELAAALPVMVGTLRPLIDAMMAWAPSIAGGLSTVAWVVWALGCACLFIAALVASALVALARRRSSRAGGPLRHMGVPG